MMDYAFAHMSRLRSIRLVVVTARACHHYQSSLPHNVALFTFKSFLPQIHALVVLPCAMLCAPDPRAELQVLSCTASYQNIALQLQ